MVKNYFAIWAYFLVLIACASQHLVLLIMELITYMHVTFILSTQISIFYKPIIYTKLSNDTNILVIETYKLFLCTWKSIKNNKINLFV